ncbi:MAG: hypothetical protein E7415_00210 [Ruminococcaceae bacterium]|nr:hypothetical protein [Oscillospiraceae bacterium]
MKVLTVIPQMIKGTVEITEKNAELGAFFIVCGAIGNDIRCVCDDFDYRNKYKEFFETVEKIGCEVEYFDDGFKVRKSANMTGKIIEYDDISGNLPAIAILCAFCNGESRIKGIPMSERKNLSGIASELSHLGVKSEITSDGILINGNQILRCDGTYVWNNPYLAMALVVAGSRCEGELRIMGTEEFESDVFNEFMRIYDKLIKESVK